MQNLRMQEKLEAGEALDVNVVGARLTEDDNAWVLNEFIEGKDYCDAENERWIWSIGRSVTGLIYASTDTRYYSNPNYECLFLR